MQDSIEATSSIATIKARATNWRRSGIIGSLMAPAVVVGLAVAATLFLMAYISVQKSFPGPVRFSLDHYQAFFSDSYLIAAAFRTLAIGAVTTLFCATLAYPISWYLVMSQSRYTYIVFIIVLTPLLVSIVVRTIGWTVLLGNEGLVNSTLMSLGVIKEPLQLMRSFWTVVVGLVHVLLPFMVLSISAVLGRIDRSAIEASKTLGATPTRTFFQVTLPLSIQGIATGAVIVFCLAVGSFLTPLWLGRGSVAIMALTVREQVIDLNDWPGGAVQAVVLSLSAFAAITFFAFTIAKMARR